MQSARSELPGTLADLAIGANGRLIVLRLREKSSLQVFDVAAREIIGEIAADDDPICFAAGREMLVLGLWGQAALLQIACAVYLLALDEFTGEYVWGTADDCCETPSGQIQCPLQRRLPGSFQGSKENTL